MPFAIVGTHGTSATRTINNLARDHSISCPRLCHAPEQRPNASPFSIMFSLLATRAINDRARENSINAMVTRAINDRAPLNMFNEPTPRTIDDRPHHNTIARLFQHFHFQASHPSTPIDGTSSTLQRCSHHACHRHAWPPSKAFSAWQTHAHTNHQHAVVVVALLVCTCLCNLRPRLGSTTQTRKEHYPSA